MPFAIIGFLLAITFTDARFDWKIFGLVILCMIFARSTAMAFNRYIDKDIDKINPRTAIREIPSGILKARSVLIFVIINAGLFITTTWFINELCFYLSPIALLVILGYSFTKRYTYLSHLILGIGLSLAPIGAYLAVTGKFDWLPLLFSFAVLFWVSGFDIIYALQDEDFDKSQNLRSIPVAMGQKNALMLSNIFHSITALFILYAGFYADLGLWYWIGSGIFIALLFYQHTLVKVNDLSKVNLAFFTTNGIASVIFASFVFLDLYL
ncbi:UbiA family prenyltransferase [bacterium AH-315-M05]|nr:UbiA family prenyltransferase [bacterium AH-315-M05]